MFFTLTICYRILSNDHYNMSRRNTCVQLPEVNFNFNSLFIITNPHEIDWQNIYWIIYPHLSVVKWRLCILTRTCSIDIVIETKLKQKIEYLKPLYFYCIRYFEPHDNERLSIKDKINTKVRFSVYYQCFEYWGCLYYVCILILKGGKV